ncbi:hypothetical protein OKW28_002642 [Paraburkholderia sp. 40]
MKEASRRLPVAPDLLQRDFSPARPDQTWTTDITYIWAGEGWLYLAVILMRRVNPTFDRIVVVQHDPVRLRSSPFLASCQRPVIH